jgi:outer membrane protein assembly factor BamA
VKLTLSVFIWFVFTLPIQGHAIGKSKEKPLQDSTYVIVNQVIVAGNTKTKEKVITRELLFQKGDTIFTERLDGLIQKSNDNLYNTSLFNFTHINIVHDTDKYIQIYVVVEERWYLWPYLILEQADRNLSSFFHEQDWSRINYGLMLVKYNFRGRRETLKVKVRLGYKEQFQIYYQIPFFLNHPKHGISTEVNWFRQKEVQYATYYDEPYLQKDYTQYGLRYQNAYFGYTYRKEHNVKHNITIGFNNSAIVDSIAILNPNYFGAGKTKNQYFSLSYEYDFDKRNYKQYPLTGYNIDLTASLKGLNIIPEEMPTIWEIQSTAYSYFDIGSRWYSGAGAKLKVSNPKKQPYSIEQGLGYSDVLRAYEYNLIDGQQFITARAFIKYAIIPFTVRQIEYLGWKKFNKIHYSLFANAFIDQGFVRDVNPERTNTLPNSYLMSFGLGVDLVAYYDQIFRFEYSMNRHGEHGFFINIGKAF